LGKINSGDLYLKSGFGIFTRSLMAYVVSTPNLLSLVLFGRYKLAHRSGLSGRGEHRLDVSDKPFMTRGDVEKYRLARQRKSRQFSIEMDAKSAAEHLVERRPAPGCILIRGWKAPMRFRALPMRPTTRRQPVLSILD
jgi:hypothetical protein